MWINGVLPVGVEARRSVDKHVTFSDGRLEDFTAKAGIQLQDRPDKEDM